MSTCCKIHHGKNPTKYLIKPSKYQVQVVLAKEQTQQEEKLRQTDRFQTEVGERDSSPFP